ncbi:MAG: hypothetical protein OXK78_20105 [Caldilineaceae bacterium]|nr:hypothetical protein [Caldilineaceae bacterium]
MHEIASDQSAGDAVARVLDAFMAERGSVYIVGGAVRDHLLGISSIPGWSMLTVDGQSHDGVRGPIARSKTPAFTTDLDLVLCGPVLPLARRVADRLGWAYYPLDEKRDVARLIGKCADGQRIECDAAALRGDLRSDLLARDFSANALALRISPDSLPRLIDECNGIADISSSRLRRVSEGSLGSDPIRLLRAVRLAVQLGFSIEHETRKQISALAGTVVSVSAERLRQEMWKLLDCSGPDVGIRELDELGLLTYLLPEVKALQGVQQSSRHHLDAYDHSLLATHYAGELRDWLRGGPAPEDSTLAQSLVPWTEALRTHFCEEIAAGHDRAGWLVWHALLHDTGKARSATEEVENGAEGQSRAGHQELSAEIAGRRVASFRFSRREVLLAGSVARRHSVPRRLVTALTEEEERIGRRAAYRFFRDAGSVVAGQQFVRGLGSGGARQPLDGLDVTLQAVSDLQATGRERGSEWGRFLRAMDGLFDYAFSRPADHLTAPLMDGHRLMEQFGLAPGPVVGKILRELAEARASGSVADVGEALALAKDLLAKEDDQDGTGT